ncbi:nitroreductase [Mycobacterium szulgai]|uniref:Nitroreductase n=2 Tax=Mycobacterium szulgai TaxID=1787 RepID=A0A1X2EXW4_MYCSZ|nr:nitroreductase [Mycobacterium szulgai]
MAMAPESWPKPLLNGIRTSNKYLLNPLMALLAGRKYWYASAIRHTGRRSGKQYVTPVVAERVADGFLIPLPYGTDTDWVRNVLAAGRASVKCHGETRDVVQPKVVEAAQALPLVPAEHGRTYARVGVERFLQVTDARS